jgi:hypothetical protein
MRTRFATAKLRAVVRKRLQTTLATVMLGLALVACSQPAPGGQSTPGATQVQSQPTTLPTQAGQTPYSPE